MWRGGTKGHGGRSCSDFDPLKIRSASRPPQPRFADALHGENSTARSLDRVAQVSIDVGGLDSPNSGRRSTPTRPRASCVGSAATSTKRPVPRDAHLRLCPCAAILASGRADDIESGKGLLGSTEHWHRSPSRLSPSPRAAASIAQPSKLRWARSLRSTARRDFSVRLRQSRSPFRTADAS